MYRRKLITRRFGALSFGLGYFDGETWVDHVASDGLLTDAGPEVRAIHAWLNCCPTTDGRARIVAVDVRALDDVRERIAVAARSASS